MLLQGRPSLTRLAASAGSREATLALRLSGGVGSTAPAGIRHTGDTGHLATKLPVRSNARRGIG